ALTDVAVLVSRFAPAAFLAEEADHHQRAPAAVRRARLAVDVQHWLELHVVEDHAVAVGWQPVKILAHPLPPNVNSAPGDLERSVRREQVSRSVPHALVDIVAVGSLEVHQIAVILRLPGALLELLDAVEQHRNFRHSFPPEALRTSGDAASPPVCRRHPRQW